MARRDSNPSILIAGLGFGVAAGVAFGAFGLGPVVAGNMDSGAEAVREEYRRALQERQIIDAQMASGDSVIADMAPTMVDGTLANRPVLLMTTSNAKDGDIKAVQSLLKSADIVNAGTIDLADAFFHQENADKLKSLLTSVLPAGAQLSATATEVGTHAGEALGAALFIDPKGTEPLASVEDRATLLQTLRDQGFISYEDGTILAAQAVVVIDGKTPGDGTSAFKATNLAAFMEALDKVGGHTVLAGRVESAADGGPIDLLRGGSPAADQTETEKEAESTPAKAAASPVSTMDSIDRAWARMATVLAVREQLDGKSGAYGSAASAEAASPARPEVL